MKIYNLKDCFEHAHTIAHWHHNEWGYLNPSRNFEKRIERMQRYLGDDLLATMWVAIDDDGTPMGTSAIVEFDMDDHKHLSPWLASVFIDPKFRKRGIGKQMVQHVMNTSKQAGHETLYLLPISHLGIAKWAGSCWNNVITTVLLSP